MGKHSKKSKKHHKHKKSSYKDDSTKRKSRKRSSSDEIESKKKRYSSSSDSSNEDIKETTQKRDDWMNLSTTFASFSKEDRKKVNEKQAKEAAQYNPSQCARELNPYWKNGGDGLPKFQKPSQNDSDSDHHNKSFDRKHKKSQSNWRKTKEPSPKPCTSFEIEKIPESDKPMTEKDLNLLAGKLVKAEIMGNNKLIEELKIKLEKGRALLAEAKLQGEEVLLTQTDRQGNSKPLTLQHEESSGSKKRKKPVETHNNQQRVRYFPDDDKYSLKQMFEDEKFNSVEAQQSEFVKIASKIRKNDDLDDLFADNVRRQKSDSDIDKKSKEKAINEHNKISSSLDNCSKCIQSTATLKNLIISMGEFVYLSLPSCEPLMEGHCLIIPIRHANSVTQLDENEWEEIKDFRRALCKLFASKDLIPIFFEIAVGFHKYPHTVLECVPVPKEEGDLAPIYFKKAIDESEYEWSENKKLVSLKGRNIRKAIPKELPYFSVSFGLEEGFAHVIETENLFPRNFAQEIIGGMLDLHHNKWRRPSRQSFDLQSKRVLEFTKEWEKFDCTITRN
ncbi:unnamed protein product [Ceutorhynchus assimilis]|uniref:CWF19-like protein 2 n=1 Tax=Ceutorhynchus assimilis TaxID=467358 RepID=A0A9N9Q9Z6_9CUCU|nr:unnamed protein product [Ceutorhynchus assimilis]